MDLEVVLKKATGLRTDGLPNPIAVLSVAGRAQRSHVVQRSRNPSWEQRESGTTTATATALPLVANCERLKALRLGWAGFSFKQVDPSDLLLVQLSDEVDPRFPPEAIGVTGSISHTALLASHIQHC